MYTKNGRTYLESLKDLVKANLEMNDTEWLTTDVCPRLDNMDDWLNARFNKSLKHFNRPVNHWDVHRIVSANRFLIDLVDFDQEVSGLKFTNAEYVDMLNGCCSFNSSTDEMELPKVKELRLLNRCRSFNQPIP